MKFIANENLSERTLGVHRVSAFYHNSKWHAQIIGTNSCHFPHNCRLCFCPQNASTLVYNCNSGYFLTHQLWKPKHVLLCFVMVFPISVPFSTGTCQTKPAKYIQIPRVLRTFRSHVRSQVFLSRPFLWFWFSCHGWGQPSEILYLQTPGSWCCRQSKTCRRWCRHAAFGPQIEGSAMQPGTMF